MHGAPHRRRSSTLGPARCMHRQCCRESPPSHPTHACSGRGCGGGARRRPSTRAARAGAGACEHCPLGLVPGNRHPPASCDRTANARVRACLSEPGVSQPGPPCHPLAAGLVPPVPGRPADRGGRLAVRLESHLLHRWQCSAGGRGATAPRLSGLCACCWACPRSGLRLFPGWSNPQLRLSRTGPH